MSADKSAGSSSHQIEERNREYLNDSHCIGAAIYSYAAGIMSALTCGIETVEKLAAADGISTGLSLLTDSS